MNMNLKINSVHYNSGWTAAQMVVAFQTLDEVGRAGEGRLMPHFINVVNPLLKEIACSLGTKQAVELLLFGFFTCDSHVQ